MNIEVLLFYVLGSLTLICGGLVINARNPVHSILFLVLVFCNSAGLLILLETEFLAMIFLVVYIGAIVVLFLFVVMMLNIRITGLKESPLRYVPIGCLVLVIFFGETLSVIDGDLVPFFSGLVLERDSQITLLQEGLNLVVWSNATSPMTNIGVLGELLYTHYFYCFLMASLILLVAMLGAILLTMRKQFNVRRQNVFDQIFNNLNTSIRLVTNHTIIDEKLKK
jgi:NADH:ubiquinone oxidoreductase subunit 6 (subunit J)